MWQRMQSRTVADAVYLLAQRYLASPDGEGLFAHLERLGWVLTVAGVIRQYHKVLSCCLFRARTTSLQRSH